MQDDWKRKADARETRSIVWGSILFGLAMAGVIAIFAIAMFSVAVCLGQETRPADIAPDGLTHTEHSLRLRALSSLRADYDRMKYTRFDAQQSRDLRHSIELLDDGVTDYYDAGENRFVRVFIGDRPIAPPFVLTAEEKRTWDSMQGNFAKHVRWKWSDSKVWHRAGGIEEP